jgi:hypothetical protein
MEGFASSRTAAGFNPDWYLSFFIVTYAIMVLANIKIAASKNGAPAN